MRGIRTQPLGLYLREESIARGERVQCQLTLEIARETLTESELKTVDGNEGTRQVSGRRQYITTRIWTANDDDDDNDDGKKGVGNSNNNSNNNNNDNNNDSETAETAARAETTETTRANGYKKG
ncbi:hypothetical protein SAMD00023353_2301260 [Rosellinia necatrix]|uniref:Uncharacterized protein n=1 Tax=Rosellinia necatrix TaxID=77044 RepID=A0A1S8A804_ROSNE|nr:hypothetical protein SAMD00023353_2301260 [Rosellinia necatrix]